MDRSMNRPKEAWNLLQNKGTLFNLINNLGNSEKDNNEIRITSIQWEKEIESGKAKCWRSNSPLVGRKGVAIGPGNLSTSQCTSKGNLTASQNVWAQQCATCVGAASSLAQQQWAERLWSRLGMGWPKGWAREVSTDMFGLYSSITQRQLKQDQGLLGSKALRIQLRMMRGGRGGVGPLELLTGLWGPQHYFTISTYEPQCFIHTELYVIYVTFYKIAQKELTLLTVFGHTGWGQWLF